MPHQFQLVAGHVILDFANTLDWRFDQERTVDLLPTYDRLLEFCVQSGLLAVGQQRKLKRFHDSGDSRLALKHALELRETVDTLVRSCINEERPSGSAVQVFNLQLARLRSHETLVWDRTTFIRSYDQLTKNAEGPIWLLIDNAVNLLMSPALGGVSECREPSCRWLFLDHSKNHSRRWCSMEICGNREKSKQFRRRRNSSGDDE